MCGIVGYVGPRVDGKALDVVMEGLARLEYRGYDSAGVALVTADGVASEKRAGKLANLREALDQDNLPAASAGIGHTRWATHGGPTDANAHPHHGGDDDRLALIHNGIIENFHSLKNQLVAEGTAFRSETDTEVVAHLVAGAYKETGDLTAAMQQVVNRLEGAFTLLAVHEDAPGVVVGARRNSPLVVGLGEGENFLGSDVAAFIGHTRNALELGQDQIVTITPTAPPSSTSTAARPRASTTRSPGTPRPPRRAATPPSWRRRSTSSPTRWRTPCSAAPTRTAAWSWTRWTSPRTTCATSTRSSSSRAAPRRTPAWSRSTPSSTVCIPVEVELAHEFRYRDPVVNERTRRVHLAVRRDHGHPHGGPPRERAPAPGPSRSATRTARPSRASRTPCSTPTPVRRSRSPRPRPSSRRSRPATSSASTSPSCAVAPTPTRPRPS